MSSRRTNNIEALSERLGSLQINKEASTEEYEQTDTEISVAPATAAAAVSENVQAGLPKSMVPDPVSRPLTVDFILFFPFHFILLYFTFLFIFLFLEQLRLGVISHAVISVTN